MDIMDIIEEYLSSHIAIRFGRGTIIRKNDSTIEVSTEEHDFIMNVTKDAWPKHPNVFATIGYVDNAHYIYHDKDDMEISSGMPTFNIVGHRKLQNVEDPDFMDKVENTLMEFLNDHEEWATRKMRRIHTDAAMRMSDEDI